MNLFNLLPEDTRSLELLTCAIFISLCFVQPWFVGAVLLLSSTATLFGILQGSYRLRTISCCITSAVSAYIAVAFLSSVAVLSVIMLAVGLSNFYAGIVNNQGSKWI